MKKDIVIVSTGLATAIALFFATPFFPFDELIVLIIMAFYSLLRLFK